VADGTSGSDGAGTPTLEEVARVAGVSRATASRVVNGSPRVSPDAKRAVDRAVRRLGYQPNRAARSLVTRRTDSIALVIPEPTPKLFGDPFFPRLLRGVSETLAARDLQLVLVMPQSPADEARVERYLLGGHVDGALLVSLHGSDPLPLRLASRGVPTVVGGRPDGDAAVSYVDVDNVDGAKRAVQHLLGRGRRRIATISGPLDMVPGRDRQTGYRQALTEAGIAPSAALEEEGDFTQETGARAMRALLARRPDLDGVFVASDLMAIGALRALTAAGRAVPTDVAVVGYDDAPLAQMTEPALSSVRQPIEEMGREMARLMVAQVSGSERVARRVILATQLVVRESSGR
jgi:DNA-binding LacI/PurR family transcriptional regulator